MVGIVAIVAAVVTVANAVVYFPLQHHHSTHSIVPLDEGIVVVGAIVNVVIYGLTAWFALQYGRGLASSMRNKDAAELEAALWWQRRYWTLQGVLMIVFIVFSVLAAAAPIILVAALHH
ncbi:MAG: hypothetical protein ACRES9_07750 [Gammaproteobacteria bacterium]